VQRPESKRTGRALILDAVLVAIAALLILVPVLDLWDADIGVPLSYARGNPGIYTFQPDALFYQMLAKGGIDHAWFTTNASLGAPFDQQLFDFPVSLDNLNLAVLKVLGTVTGSVGATVNVFYLLTFVAVAVSMLLVLRALGVSRMVAAVVALLYTYLPYHFARGVPHLFLSAFWVVPLGGYLVLRVASARPPFTADREAATADADGSGRDWRVRIWNRPGVLWLLACVAIASSGAYYAAFTLLFLVVLTIVDFIARRRTRVLASGAIALAAIGIVVLFNAAPNLVYMAVHGQDTAVVRRHPSETEYEGLKISQLVLPVEQHRVGALADLQEKSTKFTPTRSERGQQLGIIGAAGFAALLVILLVAIRRDRRPPEDPRADADEEPSAMPPPRDALLSMGVLTVTAIVFGAISGFSILVFGLGLRDLRSWNRISTYLAFFSFTTVAYGLDWLRRRIPDRSWAKVATVAGLAGVLAFGILDQVSPAVIPDYEVDQARWASDDAFVKAVQRELPDGASVYELPYRYFPEAPLAGNLGPYDLVRPYLHSDMLKWGWGGMLGREADWQASTSTLPASEMLDRVAAVGFDGLVYDLGSTYRGGDPSPEDISAVLGQQPRVSRDGELAFWDLRPYAKDLRDRLGATKVAELRRRALADRSQPAY
jgi:phosphoglycerol transferase